MLVYVNNFKFYGDDSFNSVFNEISSWLSSKTRREITTDFLKSGKELNIKSPKMIIRTYISDSSESPMYSILVSHPDHSVSGRQWVTEIGVRKEINHTFISILLETQDVSTRVNITPPTTKPKLVNQLYKTGLMSKDTIGLELLEVDDSISSFQELKRMIYDPYRVHPIVLISKKKKTKDSLVNLTLLQTQLLGLAQVCVLNEQVNTWELEKILTKDFSVWDGAIRIIYPIKDNRTTLLRSNEIDDLERENKKLSQEVLSYITHTTNGVKKREHFSPTALRATRYRLQRDNIKKTILDTSSYEQLLDEQDSLIKDLQEKLERKDYENLNLEISLEEKDNKLRELHYQLDFSKRSIKVDSSGKTLLVYGQEIDLYPNEIKELIVKIVSNHFKSCDLNSNSRKSVILKDFLEANLSEGKAESLKQQCKQIFVNYEKVTPKLEKQLREIGLIVKVTQNHNELKFIDDDRFKVTFSKSPSDKIRAGEKISIDIDNEFFY